MSDAMHALLAATPLLDVQHPDTEVMGARRGGLTLNTCERIGAVHDFVRNENALGHNEGDALPASWVSADGIGQCISATIPESSARLGLTAGARRLSAQWEGRAVGVRVRGRAGSPRDVEPMGSSGVWGTGFSWAAVQADELPSQARASELVADLDLRR